MRLNVSRAKVVTDGIPFELLARTKNELEELAHDRVSGEYEFKQWIVLSSPYHQAQSKQPNRWRGQILAQRSGSEGDLRDGRHWLYYLLT